MTPTELADLGRALYGARWQSALARALEVSDRTMRRWFAGDSEIPASAADEIVELAGRERAKKALDHIAELQRRHGPPAQINLTEGRDPIGQRATKILADALEEIGVKVSIVKVDEAIADPAARALNAALKR